MLKLSRESDVNLAKYMSHLNYLGYIYYDMRFLDRCSRRMFQEINTYKYLLTSIIQEGSGGVIHDASSESIKRFLLEHRNVPESLLYDYKTKGLSIDKKHLGKVYSKGYANEFLELYKEFTSTRSKAGFIKTCLSSCEESNKIDYSGKSLYKVLHNIDFNPTFRTYYYRFNHQQLSHQALYAMKAPKGYTLVSGDFAQSDLRIAYNMMLRSPDNLSIMYKSRDSYEGIARLVEGENFDLSKFLYDRPLYKENTLAPVYGAEGSNTEESSRIVNNVKDYLKTLPVYNKFKNRIRKRLNSGMPLNVTTYFGNSIAIDSSEKGEKQVFDAALNAPVQGGTGEIIIACANSIMDKFKSCGISEENDGIYLYLNRHDELVFLINNDYLDYCWIFQENEDIIVDDWMPLKIEFSYSDNYKEPNETLSNLCKSYYKDLPAIDINDLVNKGKTCDYFIPCEDTMELAVGWCSEGDNTVISFFNLESGKVTYNHVNTSNKNDIINCIYDIIASQKNVLFDHDITCAIAYTDLLLQDSIISRGFPVSFKVNFNDGIFRKIMRLAEEKFLELREKGELN